MAESPFTGSLGQSEAAFTGPVGGAEEAFTGPLSESESLLGPDGASIYDPEYGTNGNPIGPDSKFNREGAPIAVLGGVFSNGLPLGGPFSQFFRSTGPLPFTVFESTTTSSGPIGGFLVGSEGVELQFGPAILPFAPPIGEILG
ncbi:MAG TPA: hypothetical protein VK191_14070 [Symbiobacteriaceae bacterium]|nr:hypothetical protein [Symbiobacteriaceae bacterium]